MTETMQTYMPIFIRVRELPVLIVGGGAWLAYTITSLRHEGMQRQAARDAQTPDEIHRLMQRTI